MTTLSCVFFPKRVDGHDPTDVLGERHTEGMRPLRYYLPGVIAYLRFRKLECELAERVRLAGAGEEPRSHRAPKSIGRASVAGTNPCEEALMLTDALDLASKLGRCVPVPPGHQEQVADAAIYSTGEFFFVLPTASARIFECCAPLAWGDFITEINSDR
jgi:hypothetical protein